MKFRIWDHINQHFDNSLVVSCDGLVGEWVAGCGLSTIDEQKLYYSIELFTGLKDKNGKEIFEGDIVMYQGDILTVALTDECYGGKLGWDLLSPTGECHKYYYGGFEPSWVEVIGNIHENLGLL